jgi:hypothetical protein
VVPYGSEFERGEEGAEGEERIREKAFQEGRMGKRGRSWVLMAARREDRFLRMAFASLVWTERGAAVSWSRSSSLSACGPEMALLRHIFAFLPSSSRDTRSESEC